MAIFIPPKITSEQLSSLVLLDGELVYNTTVKTFYTGDGEHEGGFPITGEGSQPPVVVPTKLSDLTNDINVLTEENIGPGAGQLSLNEDIKAYVNDAIDAISLPTKVSDLDNDAGFITSADVESPITISSKLDASLISGSAIRVEQEITDISGNTHTLYFEGAGASLKLKTDGDLGSTELKDTEWQDKIFKIDVGVNNIVSGFIATAIGKGNSAIGPYSFAHGYKTFANAAAAHAEGHNNSANGGYSHAEGQSTIADGSYSHTEGCGAKAAGQWAHAEGGEGSEANGEKSHSEGRGKAYGDLSHAEGNYAVTSGMCAHAEGTSTAAIGESAHAEGYSTKATGSCSHAEGKLTYADASFSHSEGEATHAGFECSHAEGCYMNTAEMYQHVEGKYGVAVSGYQHVIGGGTAEARKNIQTLDWDGNQVNAGTLTAADFILAGDAETVKEKLNGILARLAYLEGVVSGAPRND